MLKIKQEELQAGLQELDQALYYHEQWHSELIRTIICHLPYNPSDVAENAHRLCRFGRWCYDTPPKALREHPSFVAMAVEHQRMHQLGAKLLLAAELRQSGLPKDYDSFKNSLDHLRLEIDTLKREIVDTLYNRDIVTGAENRVRMLIKLRELHELVKRNVYPCGIVIMDLDHFKTINDTYGHPMGDQVLATSVQNIMKHLRPYDSVFRYGGDEFLLTLPDADLEFTQTVVDRIIAVFNTLVFPTSGTQTVATTASFGITLLDPTVSVEESIIRADMALYAAKTSGRNIARAWDQSMIQRADADPVSIHSDSNSN